MNHSSLNSQHNWIVGGGGWGGEAIGPFNEHENPHFDNEKDILMSSKSYEESS